MIKAVVAAAALAVPAAAAGTDRYAVRFSPGAELLGVLHILGGAPPAAPWLRDYAARVRERFAPWAAHPAVAAYREVGAKTAAFVIDIQQYTDPPELVRVADGFELSYPLPEEELAPFLDALRDFARAADFAGFYREDAPRRAPLVEAALASWDGAEHLRALRAFAGYAYDVDLSVILTSAFADGDGSDYIVPYPDPPRGYGVAGAYRVFHFLPPETVRGRERYRPSGAGGNEAGWVYLERTWPPFEDALTREPWVYYRPGLVDCWCRRCLMGAVVLALDRAVRDRLGTRDRRIGDEGLEPEIRSLLPGLKERLAAFERTRVSSSTLSDVYPELAALFRRRAGDPPPAADYRCEVRDLPAPGAGPAERTRATLEAPRSQWRNGD